MTSISSTSSTPLYYPCRHLEEHGRSGLTLETAHYYHQEFGCKECIIDPQELPLSVSTKTIDKVAVLLIPSTSTPSTSTVETMPKASTVTSSSTPPVRPTPSSSQATSRQLKKSKKRSTRRANPPVIFGNDLRQQARIEQLIINRLRRVTPLVVLPRLKITILNVPQSTSQF